MKLSRNNIYIQTKDGFSVIANTYTRSIIKISNSEASKIFQQNFNINKNDLKLLLTKGILVPKSLNEDKFLRYLFYRQQLSDKCLVTYLMYSSACNFACKYCYEDGKASQQMSEEKIQELIKWYEYKIKSCEIRECQIVLFGGEPLLFIKKFLALLGTLKPLLSALGVVLSTKIITNGYLLNDSLIKSLQPYNLQEVQVTVDGLPPEHDSSRPLKNGNGTFEKVFNNLISVGIKNSQVRFLCRINIDKSNINTIPHFLDLLNETDPQHRIVPYFAHVTQTYNQVENSHSYCSGNVFSDEIELAHIYCKLWSAAKERGYELPNFYTLGPCMYFSANGYLITPEGNLYKCLDMVNAEDQIVGNISNPFYNYEKYYDVVLASQIESCIETDCPYIPICSNGCILESWLKYNDTSRICCKRKFMDIINHKLLSLKYNGET